GGRIVFGELDGRTTPRCERLRDALGAASVPVEISSDIRRVLWEKYLFICAQAGLTALTRCPVGVVRSIPETWRMFRTILEEVAALGRASGVALPANVVETLVKQGEALPAALMASLGNDLMQGRRLELEALHGHAVRLGSRFSIMGGAQRIEHDLRNDLYAALQRFPPAEIARRTTGDLMTRATSDAGAVRSLVGFGAISFIGTIAAFVGALTAMVSVDPWLTLWAMAPYPILIVIAKRANARIHAETD